METAEEKAIKALEQVEYVLSDWPRHQVGHNLDTPGGKVAIVIDTTVMLQDWHKLSCYVARELASIKALRSEEQCKAQK